MFSFNQKRKKCHFFRYQMVTLKFIDLIESFETMSNDYLIQYNCHRINIK